MAKSQLNFNPKNLDQNRPLQIQTGFKGADADINAFMRIMDVASAARKQEEEIGKQLNIDETKKDIRKRILETAQVTGETLTESQVSKAIESFFSDLYCHKAPKKGSMYPLALAYVNREQIYHKRVLPAVYWTIAGAITWSLFAGGSAIARSAAEKRVEYGVEHFHAQAQSLETQLEQLQVEAKLDETGQIKKLIAVSKPVLNKTDSALEKYLCNGSAKDSVTQENYRSVENTLGPVKSDLEKVNENVQEARRVAETNAGLTSCKTGLDALIKDVRGSDAKPALQKRAENTYNSGLASIDGRKLDQARNSEQELTDLKNGIKEFSSLEFEVKNSYNTIIGIVKEDAAKEKANALYTDAQTYVENGDLKQLKTSASSLNNLNEVLNKEYTIKVVRRDGYMTYTARKDDRTGNISGRYVIVEAVDPSGSSIEVSITEEEHGQIKRVSMWGERVPKSVFERIKADKNDNGLLEDENKVYAKKSQGYLNSMVVMLDDKGHMLERQGQIIASFRK